jgi:hypothetical protein
LITIVGLMTISLMSLFSSGSKPGPKRLAVYYGYPSLVNGANRDLDKAAQVFNRYHIVVFGDGLEFPGAEHENVVRLLAKLDKQVLVFGYVCLGSTQKLAIPEMQNRVLAWKGTGVYGVFLDEAGRDFGVDHNRREQMFDFIHSHGLSIFVNAFQPSDLFEEGPTHLGKGDFFLLESFVVRNGKLDNSTLMNTRLQQAARYREIYKFHLAGVTTAGSTPFSPTLYEQACAVAQKIGLDAVGWGEPSFSSQSNFLSGRDDCR